MEIYNSWYLKVSQEHSIYYECKWDKNAPPIIFLHGWPWLWFSKKDEVFFTDKNNVIFFDQRWSGKSKYDEGNMLHDNNMDACVSDILTLIDYLNLWNQVMLFWWSWWSTLALVFAIRYPEKVDCLILRWIYLAGERVEEDFCLEMGMKCFSQMLGKIFYLIYLKDFIMIRKLYLNIYGNKQITETIYLSMLYCYLNIVLQSWISLKLLA